MKKKYKNILIVVILLSILVVNIFSVDIIVNKIIEYTELFIKRIFPVSFIFFTLSNMLIEYNFIQILQRLFKIKSPYIYVFILSLISGFPSGAIYTKELLEKDIISISDANKIIMFCHFPNPLFVINSIGLILNNKILSFIILLSIIISNFIILLFCSKKSISSYSSFNNNIDFSNTLSKCIYKSFKNIIMIYGISLFFYLISFLLSRYVTNNYLYVFINGLFDLTNGVYSTSIINYEFIKIIFIIFFISFGSLSIHFQIKSILMNTSISYNKYLFGRMIACIISFLCIFFYYFIIKFNCFI